MNGNLVDLKTNHGSPEQHNVSGDREIPGRVDDNDAVLGKGEVRVPLPAVLVVQVDSIFAHIIMGWYVNGSNEFPIPGVPDDNLVLIGGADEVPVHVDVDVAGVPGQLQAPVVEVDRVHELALPGDVVSVNPSARLEMTHNQDNFPWKIIKQ